jgi:hypothetical protein
MKNKLKISVVAILASMLVVGGVIVPVFVRASVGVTADASGTVGARIIAIALSARIKNIQTRANEEITRRINALNALDARIEAMQKVSATDKANLSTTIQSQITAMNTLETQVGVDAAANSTSSLLSDVKSITGSYRIFALVIPQGAIEAAADRILDVAGAMTTLSGDFSTRITAAQSAGASVTAVDATLTDFNAKIAAANAEANAATAEVASLVPDGGVTAQMQANTAALKDARSKIQVGQQDLISARTDAQSIIKALVGFEKAGHGNASGTASTSMTISASTSASTSL